jgi:Fur family iron response transcriptional regulator
LKRRPDAKRRAFRIRTAAHLGHILGRRAITVDIMWHQIHEMLSTERGGEARAGDVGVSLATVYNTLNRFTEAALLREVIVDAGRAYFDTNNSDHHHFFFQDSGRLLDIPAEVVEVARIPEPPEGTHVARVDVVVRVEKSKI